MQSNTQALVPSKEELQTYQFIAQTATESKYFDKLGGASGILSIMLYAREIGVSPMVAMMGGFSNVQGKITISAELMNTLIRREGHRLDILEANSTACKIKGTRSDTGESYTSIFTIEEARQAGLVRNGGGWEKYPSDMLFARCISRLRRRLFSDVAVKSYVEGELDDILDEKKVITIDSEDEQKKEFLSHDQCLEIAELIGDDVEIAERMFKGYKVSNLQEIEAKHYEPIIKKLNARKEKTA